MREKNESGAPAFYFSRKGHDYVVVPLRGHITDVEFPKSYSAWLGTDLKKLVHAPIEYVGTETKIISLLKKKSKECDEVIIATDSDREGESIGWEALTYILENNPEIKLHLEESTTQEGIIILKYSKR